MTTNPPARCRIRGCAYLTRRPSGLCPAHQEDVVLLGVADPDQLVSPAPEESTP